MLTKNLTDVIIIIVNEREVNDMICGIFEEREVEKWFAIMTDNTVKVFDTLAQYGDWYYKLSREERDNIYRVYTTLNAKDRQKLKKLNLI